MNEERLSKVIGELVSKTTAGQEEEIGPLINLFGDWVALDEENVGKWMLELCEEMYEVEDRVKAQAIIDCCRVAIRDSQRD